MISIIYVIVLALVVMLSIHYGGGLGLAYASLGLLSYLALAGVCSTAGGIASNAFRITKIVDMKFQ